jgi:hypothetical protein
MVPVPAAAPIHLSRQLPGLFLCRRRAWINQRKRRGMLNRGPDDKHSGYSETAQNTFPIHLYFPFWLRTALKVFEN